MKVNESKMSLIGKARSRPEQVAKVLETAAQQGPMSAYRKAMNRLDSYTPLGYSLAGVVVEVGRGAEEFKVGQLVACAGNEFALHAEINWVPRNLCVPVPDGVTAQMAAFSTVGAIAMQGVRQAGAQLGDTACVIGLGLVGQLVVQLLVASGVRVVGIDVVAARCRLAEKAGAQLCAPPDVDGLAAIEQQLAEASGGLGADRVFLVAGGSSNAPVETGGPPGARSGDRWSTSESASWTCRGTRTTRKNSTCAFPARTAPAGTTLITRSKGLITPRATCAGQSGATCSASLTSSPNEKSIRSR